MKCGLYIIMSFAGYRIKTRSIKYALSGYNFIVKKLIPDTELGYISHKSLQIPINSMSNLFSKSL